jgi:DNA polymerase-3 subunit delta'
VERSEDKKGIGIEQIRELQRSLALTPLDGQARVAVLTEFDAASESAANALLKTLEEPPPRVTLVLTANDVEDVPPTIASRCELIALRPVPEGEIAAALEGSGASAEVGRDLARMAVGRPRWAQELLADPGKRARRQALAAALEQTLRLDLAGRFALAEEWADEDDLVERLSLWLLQLGDSARSQAGRGSAGELGSARSAIDAVMGTLQALRRNANARLALETMMLDLPSGGKLGGLVHPTAGETGEKAGRSDR